MAGNTKQILPILGALGGVAALIAVLVATHQHYYNQGKDIGEERAQLLQTQLEESRETSDEHSQQIAALQTEHANLKAQNLSQNDEIKNLLAKNLTLTDRIDQYASTISRIEEERGQLEQARLNLEDALLRYLSCKRKIVATIGQRVWLVEHQIPLHLAFISEEKKLVRVYIDGEENFMYLDKELPFSLYKRICFVKLVGFDNNRKKDTLAEFDIYCL